MIIKKYLVVVSILTSLSCIILFNQCQLDASNNVTSVVETSSQKIQSANKKEAEEASKVTTAEPQQSIVPKKYTFEWLPKGYKAKNMLVNRIAVPKGYKRVGVKKTSFAEWLRHLPLKAGQPSVYLYNGAKKGNQKAQSAVFDIDVGNNDLQQCADAVMRLRAEYLYCTSQKDGIRFNFTSGDACKYSEWKKGYRPVIRGNKVSWNKRAKPSSSYKTFKEYLRKVFQFAGTYSLSRELKKVATVSEIQSGDVFIQGGFPGHAVLVVDVAEHPKTGKRLFLLAQSYMPAQDIHLLKNPNNKQFSPWYSIDFGSELYTPEWTFKKNDLKRF